MVWGPETSGAQRHLQSDFRQQVAPTTVTLAKKVGLKLGDEITMVVPKIIARSMRRVARSLGLRNFMYLEKPGQAYASHEDDEEQFVPDGYRRVRLGMYRVTNFLDFNRKMDEIYKKRGMDPITLPK